MNIRKTQFHIIRFLYFFCGFLLVSTACAFYIQAHLGVAPWDVLHIGLQETTTLSIGTCNILVGMILVSITLFLNRTYVKIGTVLNMIGFGLLLDLIFYLQLIPSPNPIALKILWLLIGLILFGFGIALYVSVNLGAGPRDGLMLELSERVGQPIWMVRTVMEVMAVIIGWFLGGSVFIGTILFSLFAGPCIQFFMPYCRRLIDYSLHHTTDFRHETQFGSTHLKE